MLLIGDINIHVNNADCCLFSLCNFSTHKSGPTLDLVCSVGVGIDQLMNDNLYFSDHKLLTCEFSYSSLLASGILRTQTLQSDC